MKWLLLILIISVAYVLICAAIALTITLVTLIFKKGQLKQRFITVFWEIFSDLLFFI